MTRVSVVIPAYNGAKFLGTAIDSALAQTWTDQEIIVVDDGSNDDTGQVVARYGNAVRYLWQKNAGTSVTRNRGIAEAQGEYIAFLDQDDWWAPNKLELQVAALEANPEAALVYTDFETHRSDGSIVNSYLKSRPRAHGWVLDQLLQSNMILPSTVLARRAALLEAGGFDPAIRYTEDIDLWLRMAARWQFTVIPRVLAYRKEGDHNFGRDQTNNSRNVLRALEKAMSTLPLTPQQFRLAQRSAAKHLWALGWRSFHVGDFQEARRYLRDSVKSDCLRPQVWAYLAVSMLPPAVVRQLVKLKHPHATC